MIQKFPIQGGFCEGDSGKKDLDRLYILKKVQAKELTQVKAAELLALSDRQIRKLIARLNTNGPSGIRSKLMGWPSNRSPPLFKQKIITLLSEKYENFGPTLASEKLQKSHEIIISKETIRQWMAF